LAFRAQPLEEHDRLQLEEGHRIDRWPAAGCIADADEHAHQTEVERAIKAPEDMVGGNGIIQHEPVARVE
jgi:hypothetical protein